MSKETKVLVVGDKGEWGQAIRKSIPRTLFEGTAKSRAFVVSGCDKEIANSETSSSLDRGQDFAFIAAPASKHASAYENLLKKKIKSKTLLVEKPNNLEEISRIEHFKDRPDYAKYCAEEIYFIDHYLFKQGVVDAWRRIAERADQLREIAVYICETEEEMRGWMRDGKTGGVIADLAHHAVAIVNCLLNPQWRGVLAGQSEGVSFAGEHCACWSALELEHFTTFNRNHVAAENYVDFSGRFAGVNVRIVVGKQCEVDQKCIALTFEEGKCILPLTGAPPHGRILENLLSENAEGLLSLPLAKDLARQLDEFSYLLSEKKSNALRNTEASEEGNADAEGKSTNLQYAEILSDQFKHRHLYYWGTYFKLTVYFVLVLVSPYIAYYYLESSAEKIGGLAQVGGHTLLLLVTVLAFSGITLRLMRRIEQFLISEDMRLRVVHSRFKDLFRSAGISLKPEENEVGIVGNHMQMLFKSFMRTLAVASIAAAVILFVMAIKDHLPVILSR